MTANIVELEARIEKLERSIERLTIAVQALAQTQMNRASETRTVREGWGPRSEVYPNRKMPIEKHLSLHAAARLAGVDKRTLKKWLTRELGMCFPRVRSGSKILVRERDVERVLERHRDARAALPR